jgi:hypothetical protein
VWRVLTFVQVATAFWWATFPVASTVWICVFAR